MGRILPKKNKKNKNKNNNTTHIHSLLKSIRTLADHQK